MEKCITNSEIESICDKEIQDILEETEHHKTLDEMHGQSTYRSIERHFNLITSGVLRRKDINFLDIYSRRLEDRSKEDLKISSNSILNQRQRLYRQNADMHLANEQGYLLVR